MEALRRIPGERLAIGLVGLLTASLFLSTWTAAIQVADSGEVVAAACNLGVAHPPGYPLHTLLGHAFCRLPVSTAAGRVGLLSVLAGLIAVLALLGIVRRLTGNLVAAIVAALTLATGHLFWRYSSLAEVFALNVALVMLTLYFALRATQSGGGASRRLWGALAALFYGLSLSNHHSALFAGPVVAVAVLGGGGTFWARVPRVVLALKAFALGLLPYVYLLVASRFQLPRWGNTETVGGVLHHVLRRDYGSFQLSVEGGGSPFSAVVAFARSLPGQLAWVLLPLALWGLWLLVLGRRGEQGRQGSSLRVGRPMGWALLAAFLLAGPLFLSLFNVEAEGIGGQIVERFFLLPAALLCVALGVALARIERWMAPEGGRLKLYRGALAALLALSALSSYAKADVRQSFAVEDYARNVLRTAERDALIVGTGDVRLFSLMHAQRVLGLRRDVQYVDLKLLLYRWYVDQQRVLYPRFDYEFTPGRVDSRLVVHRALRAGRPVYLANIFSPRARMAFAAYPEGPLLRVLKPGQGLPAIDDLIAHNRRVFGRFLRRGRAPDPKLDPWSASLREPFARTWISLGRARFQRGARVPAAALVGRGLQWAPWLGRPAWLGQLPQGGPGAKIRTKRQR